MNIIHGNCLDALKTFEPHSIDAIVTDPPYGLSFMNKHWDYDVPSVDIWREALRVLKPGGHLLSFGGTRTYHRMVVNIEDAGFEIRDQIQWIYGTGFPKSQDISKAIDKQAGAEREVIGQYKSPEAPIRKNTTSSASNYRPDQPETRIADALITAPATEAAKQWFGWGTALKPANEPIVVARKPLEKGLTVAVNVLKWGVGGLNIDASRISFKSESDFNKVIGPTLTTQKGYKHTTGAMTGGINRIDAGNPQGRWPANVLFDEEAAVMLDEQSGPCKTGLGGVTKKNDRSVTMSKASHRDRVTVGYADVATGASRFFYVAKASKRERNEGLGNEVKQKQGARPKSADASGKFPDHDHRPSGGNNHPTVKPVKLMQYLIKLVTPPGGTVLDPFMGSGSTGVAAKDLGFKFIGIEMSEEYFEIAKRRVNG